MRLVLLFVLPIALVLAITRLLEPLDSPVDRGGIEAEAMVWGDRVFTSKAQLAAWLESRGIDYEDWVARHPGAAPWESQTAAAPVARRPAAAQERQPRPPSQTRESSARPERSEAESQTRPPSEAAPRVASVETESAGTGTLQSLVAPLLLGLIGVVGMLLITASAIPPMWYVEHVQAGLVVVDRRAEFAVAGLALLVGLGIPMLL